MLKRIRQFASRAPIVYEFGALLKLVWLRFTYSGGDIMSAILLTKSKQGLALDIGANRGQSAIRMAVLRPEFSIVSFEPNQRCRFFLQATRRILGRRFTFHLVGLLDRKATMTYYEPSVRSLPVVAEGTFLQKNLDAGFRARVGEHVDIKELKFPVVTLDEFNLSPDFIKIDVQGSELSVLRGGAATILRSHPILVVERNENNEGEVKSYLESLGYLALEGDAALARSVALDTAGDTVFLHKSYFSQQPAIKDLNSSHSQEASNEAPAALAS